MNEDSRYTVIFPQHERLLLGRAHDNAIVKTCHALARYGHNVFLLIGKTPRQTDEIFEYYDLPPLDNLHLVHLPILRNKRPLNVSWHGVFHHFCLRAIARLRQEARADLVYLREIKLARFLIKRKPKFELPLVFEIHEFRDREYSRPDKLEAAVFEGSDALITTTACLRDLVQEMYSPAAALHWIPCATEIPEPFPAFAPPSPGEPWRVGYIGQLHPDQGVDLLIRALAHLPGDVVADIIGGGDCLDDLRRIARAEGVADRVTFHGFCPPAEVTAKASGTHVFVVPCMPTRRKSLTAHLKVYEYLAMGRPVVGSDLPSTREEIEHEVTGLLFEPESPTALASTIRGLIANADRLGAMAQNARESANRYTYDARAQRLTRCFESLTRSKSEASPVAEL